MAFTPHHSSLAMLGHPLMDALIKGGRLPKARVGDVLNHARRNAVTIGESLIELGFTNEADLLRAQANLYGTRFVSTRKLARIKIDKAALRALPVQFAEKHMVFPVMYDGKVLSLVCADPGVDGLATQLKNITAAQEIRFFVARERAIKAAILKYYHQDRKAFDNLLLASEQFDEEDKAPASSAQREPSALSDRPSSSAGKAPASKQPFQEEIEMIDLELGNGSSAAAARNASRPVMDIPAELKLVPDRNGRMSALPSRNAGAEVLKVLLPLLERAEGVGTNHTFQVATLCQKLGSMMSLARAELEVLEMAAYLHDLGKMSRPHITPLIAAQQSLPIARVKKVAMAPLLLLEKSGLPENVLQILEYTYERFEGGGFPNRRSGKEIPLGSRILAVAESYIYASEMASAQKDSADFSLQACKAIAEYGGTVFDPLVVNWLTTWASGGKVEEKILGKQKTVLVVDPDREESALLEVRLPQHGFDVWTVRSMEDALIELQRHRFDIVVSEIQLDRHVGMDLLRAIRKNGWRMPVVFVGAQDNERVVSEALGQGAADFLKKPVSPELLAAKMRRIIEQEGPYKTKGVSGYIQEMSLSDVLQVLSSSRRSGTLVLRHLGQEGEMFIREGSIIAAKFKGKQGEQAVYGMLALQEGEFELQPGNPGGEDTIGISTEGLMLEAMRLIDEQRSRG